MIIFFISLVALGVYVQTLRTISNWWNRRLAAATNKVSGSHHEVRMLSDPAFMSRRTVALLSIARFLNERSNRSILASDIE